MEPSDKPLQKDTALVSWSRSQGTQKEQRRYEDFGNYWKFSKERCYKLDCGCVLSVKFCKVVLVISRACYLYTSHQTLIKKKKSMPLLQPLCRRLGRCTPKLKGPRQSLILVCKINSSKTKKLPSNGTKKPDLEQMTQTALSETNLCF